jgi:hypothetical protein
MGNTSTTGVDSDLPLDSESQYTVSTTRLFDGLLGLPLKR